MTSLFSKTTSTRSITALTTSSITIQASSDGSGLCSRFASCCSPGACVIGCSCPSNSSLSLSDCLLLRSCLWLLLHCHQFTPGCLATCTKCALDRCRRGVPWRRLDARAPISVVLHVVMRFYTNATQGLDAMLECPSSAWSSVVAIVAFLF